MFRVEADVDGKERALVADDGERMPIREDVWERLRDPAIIFAEWKAFLQKWSIHIEKAPLLKRECPTDAEYRELRTVIRMFGG